MTEDLKTRINALMHEIEFTHLKGNWIEKLKGVGVDQADSRKWVAEIGHVVDEYERSIRILIDLMEEEDLENIAQGLESWIAYTRDMTIWKLEDATQQLEGRYEKYLPDETDNDETPE